MKKKYNNVGCVVWDLIIGMTLMIKRDYIKKNVALYIYIYIYKANVLSLYMLLVNSLIVLKKRLLKKLFP